MFDLKGCTLGLQERICNNRFPCPVLVFLYATMGLHRYNFLQVKTLSPPQIDFADNSLYLLCYIQFLSSFLQGTKFQLSRLKKYIFSTGAAAATYYITLDAMDPAVGGSSLQTFQTQVSEECFGKFILTCDIARIRGKYIYIVVAFKLFFCITTK